MLRRIVAVALTSLLLGSLAAQAESPKQFLGHDVGEDRWLCNYTDLVRYFRAVEAASDRVTLRDIGETGYGQRMLMAVITSPANQRRLEELRSISERLCRARDGDEAVARALAASGKAVVWIDAGLHASECIAGQNVIELVWQMASRQDPEVQRILDNVILLACPVNPDGLQLVANAYAATGSTSLPVLYQRYCGHDNNRDFYACNTVEATHTSRVFYRQWYPQIIYNHHQSAPSGTILFTPPFRDPFNYQYDPMVVRGIELVAAHMNARFAFEGKPGVISRSGAPYSTWWNGGLRSTCYFHNMIGILTEVFGRPEPVPVTQTLNRRLPSGDYPDPVATQVWHPRQTIDYLQTANFAILDFAARYREELLLGIWRMGRSAIAAGSGDHWTVTPQLVAAAKLRQDPDSVFSDPDLRDVRVYVLRSDQPDFGAAVQLVRALQKSGIEVLRATAPFQVGGVSCPQGSFVIRTAQAFRAHIIDMFEPQWHPDDFKDGKPVPPYDAAGWTLALQLDVQVVRSFGDVAGEFEALDEVLPFPTEAVAAGPVPRVGLFDVYGGHMATGWDRWVLERYGFAPQTVWGERITRGDLRRDFDVLLFHTGLPAVEGGGRGGRGGRQGGPDAAMLAKLQQALPPFEDWSDLPARAVRLTAENSLPALREFVQQGGTLLALGGECQKVISAFELPVTVGVTVPDEDAAGGRRRARREEFYIPGSLVALECDPQDPLAVGCSPQFATMFDNGSPVLEVADGAKGVRAVARYRLEETLVSGWAVGEELLAGKAAVVEAKVGKGRVVLFGADVTYRAQPVASFKLLFAAIRAAGRGE